MNFLPNGMNTTTTTTKLFLHFALCALLFNFQRFRPIKRVRINLCILHIIYLKQKKSFLDHIFENRSTDDVRLSACLLWKSCVMQKWNFPVHFFLINWTSMSASSMESERKKTFNNFRSCSIKCILKILFFRLCADSFYFNNITFFSFFWKPLAAR
jgi:hypothetical protein